MKKEGTRKKEEENKEEKKKEERRKKQRQKDHTSDTTSDSNITLAAQQHRQRNFGTISVAEKVYAHHLVNVIQCQHAGKSHNTNIQAKKTYNPPHTSHTTHNNTQATDTACTDNICTRNNMAHHTEKKNKKNQHRNNMCDVRVSDDTTNVAIIFSFNCDTIPNVSSVVTCIVMHVTCVNCQVSSVMIILTEKKRTAQHIVLNT